jgi:hypothetical protein
VVEVAILAIVGWPGWTVELLGCGASRSVGIRTCVCRARTALAGVSLEPMAAPTNALVERMAPLVEPGDALTATFRLTLDQPD